MGLYVLISKEPGSTSKSYRWLYHSTAESLINKSGSFMAENDEIYLSVAGANSTLLEKFMENIGNDLQIEISESPTAYVGHAEQSVTITSGRPVSHLDRLVLQDGQYGWLYGSKLFEIPSDTNFTFGSEWCYTGKSTCAFLTKNDIFIGDQDNGCKCDRLQYVHNVWNFVDGTIGFSFNSNQIHMRFPNSILGVSDDATKEEKMAAFKTYISRCAEEGNPVTVQYKLATPEFVPLPEEEQAELKALKTYFPTTVFSNDQSLFMQVEYNTKVQEKEGE